ncbi:MAG: hypothetical protein NTX89_02945 [Candidatus Omnitrophica bacterium]|nr:hypothetical protein [Candidatus Omnitrophota bacterium]
MRKVIVAFGSLFLCFSLFKVGTVVAEEGAVAQAEVAANIEDQQESSDAGSKQQFIDDRQQLQEQRKEIKGNMEAARGEENQLRQRILDALQANDLQTATQLKEELRAMHQENVQGMQQDKQAMQAAKQELKNDLQQAQQAGGNNPPGPMGGPGTNWENPPGPMGGPGTSPNVKPRLDRDNNPPGPKGGAGTNWENKPGPQGGPGASPNRPGIVNPPGPRGGPKAGGNRK